MNKPYPYIISHQGQLSLPSIWGRQIEYWLHLAGVNVGHVLMWITLCDPVWQLALRWVNIKSCRPTFQPSGCVLSDFRPVTPASQSSTPSHRARNLPCRDISNKDYQSSSTSKSQGSIREMDDVKEDEVTNVSSSASDQYFGELESQEGGRQRARRSLRYDNNENIIADPTKECVLSRKRQVSSESLEGEQSRKRCRTEEEACVLELFCEDDAPTEAQRRLSRKLSSVVSRKSGQWKMSMTPTTRDRILTPQKDRMTPVNTPSKSVTFHDSVVGGGDDDSVTETQSPKGTPRSSRKTKRFSSTQQDEPPVGASLSSGKGSPKFGRRTQRSSSTQNDESSDIQGTPRARKSILSTPKSSQRGRPNKSADTSAMETPRRSSAHAAASPFRPDSGHRLGNKATPRTSDKKQKDLPVRRILSTFSPGTGRVLRPRTPRCYKFSAAVEEDDDDVYSLDDVESFSEEEELSVKKTPSRKARKEVHLANFCQLLYILSVIHIFCCYYTSCNQHSTGMTYSLCSKLYQVVCAARFVCSYL